MEIVSSGGGAQLLATHKKIGITLIEYASLFQPNEPFIIDELEDKINDAGFDISGGLISLDDSADLIGQSSLTYRQLLRTCFKRFNNAEKNGIDISHPLVYLSLTIFEMLGILAAGRKEVIMQGVPL